MASCTGAGWLWSRGSCRFRSATSRSARSCAEAVPDDDAERREVLPVLREGVGGELPAALAQRVRDVEDGEVLDPVLQLEGEHRQLVAPRDQLERPELGDLRRQPRGDVARVALHLPVAVEAEAEEVVVLRDDLGAGPREVEREGRHVVAEVVDPEDQVGGQRVGVAPDDPADARVDEPVLVAGGVDRGDARQAEVPDEVGVDERRDERARGAVDVDGDVEARLRLELVERLADLLDRLVGAVEGRAEDRDDADRVLVAELHRLLGAEVEPVALHRHEAHLDVPVVGELLPADLDVDPHHEVRLAAG